MANGLYDGGRSDLARANIDWINDDIKVMIVDINEYTIDLTSDNFLEDVPSDARIAIATLTGTSEDGTGICDADDTTFPSVAAGQDIGAVILYKNTGFENSSRLIAAYDSAVNLPAVSDGTDVIIQWPETADKLFKL